MELKVAKSKNSLFSILLITPFFLWGTAMVAMKGVMPHSTPLFIAGIRLVPAGLLILAVAKILKLPQPQGWKAWLWIIAFALVDGAMFQGFLTEGLAKTSAGLGSVIIDTQPLTVAVLSAWLFGEIIGLYGFIGLGMGILGISLIGLPDELILNLFSLGNVNLSSGGGNLWQQGAWLMLIASLSMAVGTVLVPFLSRHVDPVVATGWHMIIGGLPLFLFSGIWESEQWINLSWQGWIALGYSTVFGSAISYGIFFYLASKGNLTSLSSLTFLTPIFALIFGNLFLAEVLSPLQTAGVCLTLVSIYLINQREKLGKKEASVVD